MPRLVRLVKPTLNTVKPPVAPSQASAGGAGPSSPPAETNYSDLDANEKEHLRQLGEEYLYDRRTFNKHTEALAKLRSKVQGSVARDNLSYTYNCAHV